MGGRSTKSKLELLGFQDVKINGSKFTTTSEVKLDKHQIILDRYTKVNTSKVCALVETPWGNNKVAFGELTTNIYTKNVKKLTNTDATIYLIFEGKTLEVGFAQRVQLAPLELKRKIRKNGL